MKVKELISTLSALDQELNVMVYDNEYGQYYAAQFKVLTLYEDKKKRVYDHRSMLDETIDQVEFLALAEGDH